MANLTISVDNEVLRRARIRALQQGTSVNAVLGGLLTAYAGVLDRQGQAAENLLALSRAATARRGDSRWSRDELHERN